MSVTLLSLFGRSAAASLVVAKPGGDVHASEARIAFSTNEKRTVAWEQLVLDEARGELAWVVPVPKGGWIEAADDHVFESLDEATAAVTAPTKGLGCAPTARESTAAPRATIPPRAVSKVFSPIAAGAAVERLTSLGFVVDANGRASLAALDVAGEDVAILVLPAGPRGETRVVRVLGPRGRSFPSILAPTNGSAARLHAWVLSSSRVRFFGVPAGEIDPGKLAWNGGRSNFQTLLDDAIVASTPGVVVTYAGIDGVFLDQSGGSTLSTVPSWTRQYFGAWDSGGYPAAWTCAVRVSGLAGSSKLVAPSCAKAPPWFTSEPVPGCAVPGSSEIAPSELTCGALDDVAVAAGGLSPSRTWLTRLEGIAVPSPKAHVLEPVSLGSIPSFREAKVGDCTGTSPVTPPGGTTPPDDTDAGLDPTGEPGGGGGGGGGYHGSSSSDGCGTTLQIMSDGCSGSSSSSSSDGCGGDSSSSSDGCDGGSSSSSDGCSGASSSADDGCSSGSGGSSSGCSGAASAADDGCRVTRARPRVRFSAWIYALVAVAAVSRRIGRKPPRA